MSKARELIEFIQSPYSPQLNPWSSVSRPGAGPMGATSSGQPPTSKNTGRRKKTMPSNVDVRYIKKSED